MPSRLIGSSHNQRATVSIKTDRVDQAMSYIRLLAFRPDHLERKSILGFLQPRHSGEYPVAHCFQQRDGLHWSRGAECLTKHRLDGGHGKPTGLPIETDEDAMRFPAGSPDPSL